MEEDYGEHEEDDFQIVEEIELDYDEDFNGTILSFWYQCINCL